MQLCHRVEELDRLPPGPAVVLATGAAMAGGPSRALLTRWATDERNLIVIPGRPPVRVGFRTTAAPIVAGSHCCA